MSFKQKDIITFSDGSKVYVMDSILYEGKEYLFVNKILPDESDVTNEYKVLCANYNTGMLDKITDEKILTAIVPVFEEHINAFVGE